MRIGYEAYDCIGHEQTYYGGLVERLKDEFKKDFELFQCRDADALQQLDGKYDLIICKSRLPAQIIADRCHKSKSFVIDHGPIHSNRTYTHWCRAHFEVFSSPTLQRAYESTGFRPLIKGYSGGYFLTNSLDLIHPDPNACLVYLIPWGGLRANSVTDDVFPDTDTVALLRALALLFERVYVTNHVCDAKVNFAIRYEADLPRNVFPVRNGSEFRDLICNVGAVVFEYSSVFAIALWNPKVRLFYRCPTHPYGPAAPHNQIFHYIMGQACYTILNDDLNVIKTSLCADVKKEEREKAKKLIYDDRIEDPFDAIIESLRDALTML
jgi:hypothetical protein